MNTVSTWWDLISGIESFSSVFYDGMGGTNWHAKAMSRWPAWPYVNTKERAPKRAR